MHQWEENCFFPWCTRFFFPNTGKLCFHGKEKKITFPGQDTEDNVTRLEKRFGKDTRARVCMLGPREIEASVSRKLTHPIELKFSVHLKRARNFLRYHH